MITAIECTVGNTTGQWFTEWRFDELRRFLEILTGDMRCSVERPHLYYDANEDFHILTFSLNGHDVLVRYYKVLSAIIDGKMHWQGCPVSGSFNLAKSIKQATN